MGSRAPEWQEIPTRARRRGRIAVMARIAPPTVAIRTSRLVPIAAAICVAVAGCGGSNAPKAGSGGAPVRKGTANRTLVVVSPVGVPSLDGQNFGSSAQQEVLVNVGEPMLRFKPLDQKDEHGLPIGSQTEFVGGACARFSLSGTTFRCTLGRWVSPYGNRLTSADVKFTFDYLLAAKGNGLVGLQLAGIDAKNPVTVISPDELEINLVQHNTTVMPALTFWSFAPLDGTEIKKHATADDPFARKWMAGHTAMFGPYTASRFVANQEVELVKNPHYAANPGDAVPAPTYAKVVYRAVPSDGTRAQLLCSGTAQVAKTPNVNLYEPLKGCQSVTTFNLPYLAGTTLYFNVKRPPFDTADLRKAIDCAVDSGQISQSVYHGQWPASTSLISPKIPSQAGNFVVCPNRDPERAKGYLKAAGYHGETLPLYYSVGNSGQDAQENATLIQAQLGQIGIKTSLEAVADPTKYFVGAITAKYGMFIFVWGANVPTAAWTLGAWFGPESSLNATGYATARTAEDLRMLQTSPLTSKVQTEASIDFQKQFLQNAVVVPLVHQQNSIIVHESVCGLRSDPGDFPFWQYLHPCG
jgi:peptide/nickel transport system substrate-binding protein